MPRAVIVATGYNLDGLPQEVQDVANAFSAGGWKVRLCIGRGASRAGLAEAAAEGQAKIVWFGCHSEAAGLVLDDGVFPPAELGAWLVKVRARECVLNACSSIDLVTAIQRAAQSVGISCSIDQRGITDEVAWKIGVPIANCYVETGDMALAVKEATGNGVEQYRYIPARRREAEGGRRMPESKIEEQLRQLLLAIYGDPKVGFVGLVESVNQLRAQVAAISEEQRIWRAQVDQEIAVIEHELGEEPPMNTKQVALIAGTIVAVGVFLLFIMIRAAGA